MVELLNGYCRLAKVLCLLVPVLPEASSLLQEADQEIISKSLLLTDLRMPASNFLLLLQSFFRRK